MGDCEAVRSWGSPRPASDAQRRAFGGEFVSVGEVTLQSTLMIMFQNGFCQNKNNGLGTVARTRTRYGSLLYSPYETH